MRTADGQQLLVHHVSTFDQLAAYREFLYEGWQSLNSPLGANVTIDWDEFMQTVIFATCSTGDDGLVLVATSKNGKPLLYMIMFDDTESIKERSLFIYAGYSNSRCPTATAAVMEYVCKWATEHNYDKIRAQSRRLNGAAMRWFKRTLKFKPIALLFERTL